VCAGAREGCCGVDRSAIYPFDICIYGEHGRTIARHLKDFKVCCLFRLVHLVQKALANALAELGHLDLRFQFGKYIMQCIERDESIW
jgi:hypothetical protein